MQNKCIPRYKLISIFFNLIDKRAEILWEMTHHYINFTDFERMRCRVDLGGIWSEKVKMDKMLLSILSRIQMICQLTTSFSQNNLFTKTEDWNFMESEQVDYIALSVLLVLILWTPRKLRGKVSSAVFSTIHKGQEEIQSSILSNLLTTLLAYCFKLSSKC